MTILLYISLLLFILLITAGIYKTKGIPYCISNIYYKIGHWFTLLLGGAAMILLPYMLYITPDNYQIFAFICCATLVFVSVAARYLQSLTMEVHIGAAILSFIFGIIWVSIMFPIALFTSLIAIIAFVNKSNWIFWVEITAFIIVYTCVLFL